MIMFMVVALIVNFIGIGIKYIDIRKMYDFPAYSSFLTRGTNRKPLSEKEGKHANSISE